MCYLHGQHHTQFDFEIFTYCPYSDILSGRYVVAYDFYMYDRNHYTLCIVHQPFIRIVHITIYQYHMNDI